MIFSAAALMVKLSIFLPIKASMRRLEPSCVHDAAPSNCAAEACPATSSAVMTACRNASTVGGAADCGALASDPSVSGSANFGAELEDGARDLPPESEWVRQEVQESARDAASLPPPSQRLGQRSRPA